MNEVCIYHKKIFQKEGYIKAIRHTFMVVLIENNKIEFYNFMVDIIDNKKIILN